MNFGFSYIGLIWLAMLIVPNIIWTKNQPKDYEKYAKNENRILFVLERVGQILVTCAAVVFSDFNLKPWTAWSLWLATSFALMLLYEIYWVRYFRSEKTMRDYYTDILKIPIAGATLPVAAFFLLGIYGRNVWMLAAVVVLGIGHVGIHLGHRREVREEERKAKEGQDNGI